MDEFRLLLLPTKTGILVRPNHLEKNLLDSRLFGRLYHRQ